MYVCMYVCMCCSPDLSIFLSVSRSLCGHAVCVQAVRVAAIESVGPLHDLRLGADPLDKRAEGRPQGARGPHALRQVTHRGVGGVCVLYVVGVCCWMRMSV